MEKRSEHIEQLIIDKLSGNISDADLALLNSHLENDSALCEQYKEMEAAFNLLSGSYFIDNINVEKRWNELVQDEPATRRLYPTRLLRIAASILLPLLIAFGGYYYFAKQKTNAIDLVQRKDEAIKIVLADGRKMDITSGKTVSVGPLVFGADSARTIGEDKSVALKSEQLNSLQVPSGKDYIMTLPDGTKVFMNAASELKFPTIFQGNSRIVHLEGEAYFEVAKNRKKPFYVYTKNMKIEVTGTKFNVQAYPGDPTQTSLVEGGVSINASNGQKMLLTPGQAAWFNNDLRKHEFEKDETLAWLNGEYYFKEKHLKDIIKMVSRTTGYDFFLKDGLGDKIISGAFDKRQNIEVFLSNISYSSGIKVVFGEKGIFLSKNK